MSRGWLFCHGCYLIALHRPDGDRQTDGRSLYKRFTITARINWTKCRQSGARPLEESITEGEAEMGDRAPLFPNKNTDRDSFRNSFRLARRSARNPGFLLIIIGWGESGKVILQDSI